MAPMPIGTLPDTVPTLLPMLLILQWLISLDWFTDTEFVNDLYQFTGTDTCRHTSLSLPLAQDTDFFATYCRSFCICMHNFATIMMATLVQVPPSVLPALPGNRVPAQAGEEKLAGGPCFTESLLPSSST